MSMFSRSSKNARNTTNEALQVLFYEVVKHFDCKVTEGYRTVERQKDLVASGASKTMNSRHLDGNAVDVYPYPIRIPDPNSKSFGKDLARFYYFGGFVKGMATAMGISIRWGGDWDGDTEVNDQSFDDLPHFELKEE